MIKENNNARRQPDAVADLQHRKTARRLPHHKFIIFSKHIHDADIIMKSHDRKRSPEKADQTDKQDLKHFHRAPLFFHIHPLDNHIRFADTLHFHARHSFLDQPDHFRHTDIKACLIPFMKGMQFDCLCSCKNSLIIAVQAGDILQKNIVSLHLRISFRLYINCCLRHTSTPFSHRHADYTPSRQNPSVHTLYIHTFLFSPPVCADIIILFIM